MNLNNLSIATITWARNEKEEYLLRKSMEQLAKLSIPVFITDGGSGEAFIAFIKTFSNFTILKPAEKGVWAQVKTSLEAAHNFGSDFIFYTEPDKYDFFKQLSIVLNEVTVDKQTGIVLAARSQTGFATFPAFQQMTETSINNCCKEIIGKQADYTYGPFILNRSLISYLLTIAEDIGWGWRSLSFGIAHRLGFTIQAIEKYFKCPEEQRNDNPEERVYRIKQLQQHLQGILLSKSIIP